jgi:hypothetical protein
LLLDLVIHSITGFQSDCLKLCERHYPAVHNRGMKGHHLSLAFAKRLSHTQQQFGHMTEMEAIDTIKVHEFPHHYRITSELGSVWVLTHHLVNASKHSRDSLMLDVDEWLSEYAFAIQPSDLLVLISDHWISRSVHSKELMHWWTGEMPDDLEDYVRQGIVLHESHSQFAQTLYQRFSLSPCFIQYGHPLKRSSNQELVRKYVQLYAVIQKQ